MSFNQKTFWRRIYPTHQREDLYPEPKRFKPERFLERFRLMNFSHLAVAIVALGLLPYLR